MAGVASNAVLITGIRTNLGVNLSGLFPHNSVIGTASTEEKVRDFSGRKLRENMRVFPLDFSLLSPQDFRNQFNLGQIPPKSLKYVIHIASPYDSSKIANVSEVTAQFYTSFIQNNVLFFQSLKNCLAEDARVISVGSIAGVPGNMNGDKTMYSFYKATLYPLTEALNKEASGGALFSVLTLGNMRAEESNSGAFLSDKKVAEKIKQILEGQEFSRDNLLVAPNDPSYKVPQDSSL